MARIQVAWHKPLRLPLLSSGAVVALHPLDLSLSSDTQHLDGKSIRRQSVAHCTGDARVERRITRSRRVSREAAVVGEIKLGRRRIQLRLIGGAKCRSTSPFVRCRLTAFVYPQEAVDDLARALTVRELRVARLAIQRRSPDPQLGRDLRIYSLLRLQAGRALRACDRSHPQFMTAWRAVVRSEHRRMQNRIRHAVRRLQRALDEQPAGHGDRPMLAGTGTAHRGPRNRAAARCSSRGRATRRSSADSSRRS